MEIKNSYKPLILYFFCIITYSFAAIMNNKLLQQATILKELSYNIVENIYYHQLRGYFFAIFTLLVFRSYFKLWQIVIVSIILYVFSLFVVGFFDFPFHLARLYSVFYPGANLVIIISLFCHIISDIKIPKIDFLALFFISIFSAYLLVECFLKYDFYKIQMIDIQGIKNLMILNIIPIAIFLFIFTTNYKSKESPQNKIVNVSLIIKNIELELLSVFVIFYILMTIFFGYEVYALTESLLIISISEAKYYIFFAMLIPTIFMRNFISRYNSHLINILCIGMLLLMFISMSFWGKNIIVNSIFWFIIALLLYILFWSNLYILAEKFQPPYLDFAIIIYFLVASVGYYCGYVNSDITEDTIGKNAFLISICLILGVLFVYYLVSYKKNNFKNW